MTLVQPLLSAGGDSRREAGENGQSGDARAREEPTPLHAHVKARTPLPSRYTDKGSDVATWVAEKTALDSARGVAEDLWLVHGKWYDLTDFVAKHPGGPDWLLLTRGQDITEAFECHHVHIKRAEVILRAYYVHDADPGYVGRYSWCESGFYPTLKRRVADHFARKNGRPDTGHTTSFLAMCGFAIAVHFATCALLAAFPCILTAVLAGATLQAFHGIGHNALHMKDNWLMYCYDFCGWKHHKHRVSHAISHHLHPNTALDLEHPEPGSYVRTNGSVYNSNWVVLTGPLLMWSGPLRTILSLWLGLARGAEPFRKEYLLNMLQLAVLLAAAGPLYGLLYFAVIHFVCGFCIETAGFGLHRSEFCWSEGDTNEKIDFGEHCLATTSDHDVDMPLLPSLYLFQILNNHGIHHMFPTVCKSRICEIMPIFRQTCEEFQVPWQENPWGDMFGSLWKVWLRGMYPEAPMRSTPPMGHMSIAGSQLRLHPSKLGATVTGVNLASLSANEVAFIRRAFTQHAVLIFPDQKLSPDEEVAFAQLFPYSRTCSQKKLCGPQGSDDFDAEWDVFKLPSRREIQLRGYGDLKDHYGVTGFLETGKNCFEFHADSIHEYDTPPVYTSLYCLKSPGGQTDATIFIDARRAYDLLTEEDQMQADTLFVQYCRVPAGLEPRGLAAARDTSMLGPMYERTVAAHKKLHGDEHPSTQVSQVHPLVWTHPSTGRKAIIAAPMWTLRIVEQDSGRAWSFEETHAYLERVFAPAWEERLVHEWSPNQLVCFDNRSVLHSASPVSEVQAPRLLHQIEMCGESFPMGPAGTGVGNPTVNPNFASAR